MEQAVAKVDGPNLRSLDAASSKDVPFKRYSLSRATDTPSFREAVSFGFSNIEITDRSTTECFGLIGALSAIDNRYQIRSAVPIGNRPRSEIQGRMTNRPEDAEFIFLPFESCALLSRTDFC